MTDPVTWSATEAAQAIGRKEISARELTEALFSRIDQVNPMVNAVVEIRGHAALLAASRADSQLARGDATGPLHGVPMTIKDSFHVAGLHTTWGNPAWRDEIADVDATVVRRLERAGAIIVGKSNVHFMLSDYGQTSNELFGTTNNPWDLTRSPGGSTGGGAAALASGMTFLEYGSDLVGSIRIPAAFCGVYGLKPSSGIVPLTGFQPPGPPAPPSPVDYLTSVGPLARSAADLRTALTVTGGPELPARNAFRWGLAPSRHARLSDFRVGVVLDHPAAPVSSEVGSALSNAVDAVDRAGATIVTGWPDDVDPVAAAECFGLHIGLFFAFQDGGSNFADLSSVIRAQQQRLSLQAAWSRYFADVDVLLCPANFTPAFPHDTGPFAERMVRTPEGDRPYDNQPFWISHASLPGLPAVVAPIGRTAGGLPVGAQIIGPLYEDDTAITFAELMGEVVGGFERPPL